MSDELPEVFERLTLPKAPAELRGRVLLAVEHELKPRRRPRWERVFELASAASLLIGIGLTAWQWNADEAWHGRAYESPVAQHNRGAADERPAELAQGPAGWLVYAQDLTFSNAVSSRSRKRGI